MTYAQSMHILEVTDGARGQRGGVPTVVKELSEAFVHMGHKCTILETGEPGRPTRLVDNGVHIISSGVGSSGVFCPVRMTFVAATRKAIATTGKTDIVHIHGFHSPQMLTAVTLIEQAPIVLSTHYHGRGHTPATSILFPLYRCFGSMILRKPQAIVAVSEYERELLVRSFPRVADKCYVIANGVENFRPSFQKLRTFNGILRVLTVSRLDEYKGIQFVLRGIAHAVERMIVDVRYTIIGSGLYEPELRELAKSLRIEERVSWLKNVGYDELSGIYAESDVFVLLSEAEAYGLVVAEALVSGIPCVISNGGALSEFSSVPGCRVIVEPGNSQSVAEAIVEAAMEMKEDPRPFNNRKIRDWNQTAKEYSELFEKLTASDQDLR